MEGRREGKLKRRDERRGGGKEGEREKGETKEKKKPHLNALFFLSL